MLVTRTDAFDKDGRFYGNARTVLGDTLGVAPGPQNAQLRRRIQPAFRLTSLAEAVPSMSLEARRLSAQWRAGTGVDVTRAVSPDVHRPESARATSSP